MESPKTQETSLKILLDIILRWVSFERVFSSVVKGGEVEREDYGED